MATKQLAQQKKQLFLVAFAERATITSAAEAAGINRRTHYDWLKSDPEYAEAFRAAEREVADSLEAEAIRRARDGVDKPVFQGGRMVGTVREFSDTLLIFLLKGHKPEKFKDRYQAEQTITVHDGSAVDREIERLTAELAQRASGRAPGGTAVAGDGTA